MADPYGIPTAGELVLDGLAFLCLACGILIITCAWNEWMGR